jgi:hypothetical protein
LTQSEAAERFCAWLQSTALRAGFLTEDHEVLAVRDESFEHVGMSEAARREGLRPFRVRVRPIPYGVLEIMSSPPGAEVLMNDVPVGRAEDYLVLPKVKPGPVDLLFVLEGYKPLARRVEMEPGGFLRVEELLEENQGVVFGKAWQNSMGMRFVPVGPDLMAAVWETRVGDYAAYLKATGAPPPPQPDFPQGEDHPVVNVSREDAEAFCEWLTLTEQEGERIARSHVYRLPTDVEWSLLAGLVNEGGISPGWREARKQAVFPWGTGWLGREPQGNFSDITAAAGQGVTRDRSIPGYDDGFAHTAPVGSFPANPLGIHDLSGNVQEWVSDDYSRQGTFRLGVLRGGGWTSFQPEDLYTGARNAMPPSYRDVMYGFRVVLSKVPAPVGPPVMDAPGP